MVRSRSNLSLKGIPIGCAAAYKKCELLLDYYIVNKTGGSGWGSNPPRPATRPAAGFEDREALRDLTTPGDKHTRMVEV